MHEYGLNDAEMRALPIRRFWFLSDQIPRIRGERNRGLLDVMIASQGQKGLEWFTEQNNRIVGEIWKTGGASSVHIADENLDPDFDVSGLLALKMLA